MDWVQLANGVAVIICFFTAQLTLVSIQPFQHKWMLVLHLVHCTFLMWYGALNLLLAFGQLQLDDITSIPYFRYAFAPLLLTFALRQYIAYRRVKKLASIGR